MSQQPPSLLPRTKILRLVIVEDHVMFRELLHKVCSMQFGYNVVAETDSGDAAAEIIVRLQPDIAILDMRLPDLDGFDVVARVQGRATATRFLAVSAYCDEYSVFRAEKIKLHGFIDKNTNVVATLAEAFAALEAGRTYYSATYQAIRTRSQRDPLSFLKILSDSEQRILGLVGRGLTDAEIAQQLGIAVRTAQTHRSHILCKLRICGTPKLMIFAVQHGLTHVPPMRPFDPT